MYQIKNFFDNDDVKVIDSLGAFSVVEYQRDLSVTPQTAMTAYYANQMNVRKKQVVCDIQKSNVTVQAGAMQWTGGNIQMSSGIKGVGDFLGKAISAKVTKESAAKPEYNGYGLLMLEPTYKHIILLDVAEWNGAVVLDDGLFLACDSTLQQKVVARSNVSSAVLGGEGLFNLSLRGEGIAVLESSVPQAELIELELNDDVVKIDGNMAIAWSDSLQFTVEKAGKSLLGSAVSGEGFVNVYKGTGKILMAPTA